MHHTLVSTYMGYLLSGTNAHGRANYIIKLGKNKWQTQVGI